MNRRAWASRAMVKGGPESRAACPELRAVLPGTEPRVKGLIAAGTPAARKVSLLSFPRTTQEPKLLLC